MKDRSMEHPIGGDETVGLASRPMLQAAVLGLCCDAGVSQSLPFITRRPNLTAERVQFEVK